MNILRDFPMKNVTSLGVGGPADYFVKVKSKEDIQEALQYAEQNNLPVTTIGYGSNLLVTDKGIRGLVIQIADSFASANINGSKLTATSGCLLSCISKFAACHALSGLEFAVGIPGSLGGAIYMNAGAYGGEIGPLVENVVWITSDKIGEWNRNEFYYSYRSSRAQQEKVIIAEATLSLTPGDRESIFAKMKELQAQRIAKQPLELPSAGSTFKRPPNAYVGPLIEKANLKGYQIGGAQVSTKHAGFIVNTGDATAQDVLDLIQLIQKTIKKDFGIELEPEIRIIGEL